MLKNTMLALIIFIIGSVAQATDLKIMVNQVSVYQSADPNSQVISTLFKGDTVKVSNKSPQGYQKVLIETGGQKQVGYIKNADLRMGKTGGGGAANVSGKRGGGTRYVSRGLRNRWALGAYGGLNYQSQGARSSTETNGNVDNYATMTGASTRFGLNLQFPVSAKISGKGYVELKSVSVTGSGVSIPFGQSTGTPQDTLLKESYLALGLMGQYYFGNTFWGGVGGEYQKANSGTIQAGSNPASTLDSSNLVSFIYLYAAAGLDFELSRKLYLTTDLRFGSLLSKPIILEGDLTLMLSYAF